MLIFLKLGGSLITDKTQAETVRYDVLQQVAAEIADARRQQPELQLVLGHGSGSFGHVAGAKHGTRHGVASAAQWIGFNEVADAALRLNSIVRQALLAAGVPALSLPPRASARCSDGRLVALADGPVWQALANGLVPLLMGDVAFDDRRGGVIVSTEEVFAHLLPAFTPDWLLLAGETAGVYDGDGRVIEHITPANFDSIAAVLGGSRGADVTGGMAAKVRDVLALTTQQPQLGVRIFSGLQQGTITRLLLQPATRLGTLLSNLNST